MDWKRPKFFYLIRHEDTKETYKLGDNIEIHPLGAMPNDSNTFILEKIDEFFKKTGHISPETKPEEHKKQRDANTRKFELQNKCALLIIELDREFEKIVIHDLKRVKSDEEHIVLYAIIRPLLYFLTVAKKRPMSIEACGYFNPFEKKLKTIIITTEGFAYEAKGIKNENLIEYFNKNPDVYNTTDRKNLIIPLELLSNSYLIEDRTIKFFLRFCALENITTRYKETRPTNIICKECGREKINIVEWIRKFVSINNLDVKNEYLDLVLEDSNSKLKKNTKKLDIFDLLYAIRNKIHHIGEPKISSEVYKKLKRSEHFSEPKVIATSAFLLSNILEEYFRKGLGLDKYG